MQLSKINLDIWKSLSVLKFENPKAIIDKRKSNDPDADRLERLQELKRKNKLTKRKQQEMIEKLTKQLQSLVEELQSLEREFVAKKEQFLKVQGALEALVELNKEEE